MIDQSGNGLKQRIDELPSGWEEESATAEMGSRSIHLLENERASRDMPVQKTRAPTPNVKLCFRKRKYKASCQEWAE